MLWPALRPRGPRGVDAVALGENSLDYIGLVDGPIPEDGKRVLQGFHVCAGGQAATAALTCARQDLAVRYVGAFGHDEAARAVRAALADGGVEVVSHDRPGAGTRSAIIVVNTAGGTRCVLERRDPALRMDLNDGAIETILGGRLLLLDATDLPAATAAAEAARARGIPTVIDVDRIEPGTSRLLASIDVIVVPAPFLRELTGVGDERDGLERLSAEFGPLLAVVTLGDQGSLALSRGHEIRTPAFLVDAVDTTGAGDAFRGGFASAWLRAGGEPDLATLLECANATAALGCRGIGAQATLPDTKEVGSLVTGRGRRQSKG